MLFQKQCLHTLILITTIVGFCAAGCNNKDKNLSPQDYDLNKPYKVELGKGLNEISGICYTADDSSLLAISDSKEKVYQINLKSKKLKDYTGKVVPSNADLEDVVKVDTSLFLLMSKGVLVELSPHAEDTSSIKTYQLGLSGANDFETVYYDPTAGGLVLLCKTCAREKGRGVRTAFRFDLATRSFDSTTFFTISRGEIEKLLKISDAEFKPSAAAIHPFSKRLYILSSAGQLLVVTDTRGQVAEAYNLNPDLFPQAEGIAFAPNGDMYITNEAKDGAPTLLRFPYLPNEKKK